MTSTYVNDLRLNEMATGDASGSWGTVTNTNLELIGEALGYGTDRCLAQMRIRTTSKLLMVLQTQHGLCILEYTNGNLSGDVQLQYRPNTVSRLMFY